MDTKFHKSVITITSVFILTLAYGISNVGAVLISSDSTFGTDTITLDTDTGLQWLDVPLSTAYTYGETLDELQSGGIFDGYRLATQEEVLTLWENSGINTGLLGSFVSENYEPIVNLMSYVGVTSHNGNLGDGISFDYTYGNFDNGIVYGEPVEEGTWVTLAGISAVPIQESVYDLTGRASFGTVPFGNDNTSHGSWLVASTSVPEPSIVILFATGLIGLGFMRRRATK